MPRIREWLHARGGAGKELMEPFAGGGIVSLTVACENLVDRITMVEKDEDVAAVWQVILNGGAEWLADEIAYFQLTPDSAKAAISRADKSLEYRVFATIIKFGSRFGLAKNAIIMLSATPRVHSIWTNSFNWMEPDGFVGVFAAIAFLVNTTDKSLLTV
jgi:hypothetical protein